VLIILLSLRAFIFKIKQKIIFISIIYFALIVLCFFIQLLLFMNVIMKAFFQAFKSFNEVFITTYYLYYLYGLSRFSYPHFLISPFLIILLVFILAFINQLFLIYLQKVFILIFYNRHPTFLFEIKRICFENFLFFIEGYLFKK
jgi:hypothetical protein